MIGSSWRFSAAGLVVLDWPEDVMLCGFCCTGVRDYLGYPVPKVLHRYTWYYFGKESCDVRIEPGLVTCKTCSILFSTLKLLDF